MGGPYESAQDAALAYLGYDVDDLPSDVVTWFSYSTVDGGSGTSELPNYADFAYFKSTFQHYAVDVTRWYSTLEGTLLSANADAARAEIRAALVYYGAWEAAQSAGSAGSGDSSNPTLDTSGWYIVTLTKNCPPYTTGAITSGINVYNVSSMSINESTGVGSVTAGSKLETVNSTGIDEILCYIDPYTYNLMQGTNRPVNSFNRSLASVYAFMASGDFAWEMVNDSDSNYYIKNLTGETLSLTQYTTKFTTLCKIDGKYCCFMTNATTKNLSVQPNATLRSPYKPYWNNYNADPENPNGGGTPTVPPTQWPDSPTVTTPDPPTVDPPTTPTEPTTPTSPTPPTYPTPTDYPDVTYTDADIAAVLDAMNEHCDHITSAVYSAGAAVYSNLSSYLAAEFSATRGLMRSLSVWEVSAIGGYFDSLFGYFDDLTTWLDDRLKFDSVIDLLMRIYGSMPSTSAIEGYLEDILSAITNLQDEETNVPLIRGYLKGIFDDLEALVMPDITALEHQLVDSYETDGITLTVRGLLRSIDEGIAAVNQTLGEWAYPEYTVHNYSDVLGNIYDELVDFADSFYDYWVDFQGYLNTIISDIEALNDYDPRWYTPHTPDPNDPNEIVHVTFDPPAPYDPDWKFWTPEELNIPAFNAAVMELFTKFPFCMLSDLLTMFMYIHRDAVAPAFDLPMPNPSDWSTPHLIHIDLSQFDMAAAVLRIGITLWVGVKITQRSVRMWTKDEMAVE